MEPYDVEADPLCAPAQAAGVNVARATSHEHLVDLTLHHFRDTALQAHRSEICRHLQALRSERREIAEFIEFSRRKPAPAPEAMPRKATRAALALAKLRSVLPRRIGETSAAWYERARAQGLA